MKGKIKLLILQEKSKSNLIADWIFFILGIVGFIVTLIPTIESEGILLLVLWELFVVEIVRFLGQKCFLYLTFLILKPMLDLE